MFYYAGARRESPRRRSPRALTRATPVYSVTFLSMLNARDHMRKEASGEFGGARSVRVLGAPMTRGTFRLDRHTVRPALFAFRLRGADVVVAGVVAHAADFGQRAPHDGRRPRSLTPFSTTCSVGMIRQKLIIRTRRIGSWRKAIRGCANVIHKMRNCSVE